MTAPELPPLPPPYQRRVIATARNTLSVRSGLEMGGYEKSPDLYSAKQLHEYVEARERILLARVAEADEQRAQWAGLCTRLEARIESLEAINENNLAEAAARIVDLEAALSDAVALYGKPGGPWNIPSDPGGWLERARAAITASLGIDTKALLALNRETGRVSLHDHSDDLSPATYFARGVTRTSDPDDLADDLIDEAIDCGLLTPRSARGVAHRRAVTVPVINMSALVASATPTRGEE